MQTECIRDMFGFEAVEGRQVIAAFDGGAITSDAGLSNAQSVDQRMRLGMRSLLSPTATCRRTRPGSYRPIAEVSVSSTRNEERLKGSQQEYTRDSQPYRKCAYP
jgi:hypothetical protein